MASDKPIIICYQRPSKSIKSSNSHMVGEASDPSFLRFHRTKLTHSDEDQQILLSPCVGRKRMRMGERKAVTLPEDIIYTEILTRLPPKHIQRCRLVCKSWNSSVSTSDFVNSHLNRQLDEDEEDRIIVKCDDYISILSRTNSIRVPNVLPVCDTLLGSINGLILMSTLRGKRFCLWNPAIAQVDFFDLPPPHLHPNKHNCQHLLGGFCWDHVQNDYKALLFCYDDSETNPPSQLCIYSTNSATWTPLRIPEHTMLPAPIYKSWMMAPPSTIVKGTPYWSYSKLLTLPGKKRRRRFFFAFKFVPEINEFRILPDLDSLKFRGNNFYIVNIKDRLVGMTYKLEARGDTLVDIYSLDNEESNSAVWSKMYTIGPVYLRSAQLLSQCFRNGGEILIRGCGGPFLFYDPKTKENKEIAESAYDCFRQCYSYTPSLVRVRGMRSMHNVSNNEGFKTHHFVDPFVGSSTATLSLIADWI